MTRYTQIATYWAPSTYDAYGDPSFSAPVSMLVRWEKKRELYIGDKGNQLKSNSIVYVQIDVLTDGYLLLGASVAADPKGVTDAYLIRGVDKIPSINGDKFIRKAWL